MKPIVTTSAMAVIAFACCAAAWHYYPRIDEVESVERETLLTEDESFESRDVRRITIEEFDRDQNSVSEFEIEFEGGSWVIPDKSDYPATNAERVAAAVNAMSDKDVLEMVSDNKDDHEKFNVLELSEAGNRGTGVGVAISYEASNGEPLGKLIVGSPTGKGNQRYVRLAGQPQIYIVEFDDSILTTQLADWTKGDLMRFGDQLPNLGELVERIEIDLYYLSNESGEPSGEEVANKNFAYRAMIRVEDGKWLCDLWKPTGENRSLPAQPTEEKIDVSRNQAFREFVGQLQRFPINDVVRKSNEVAFNLASPTENQPASHFNKLARDHGFYRTGFDNGQHQFDAAAGEVTIVWRFGMRSHIYAGKLGGNLGQEGKINRYLMLTSDVDPSIIPKPEQPGSATSPESGTDQSSGDPAESEEAAQSDDEKPQEANPPSDPQDESSDAPQEEDDQEATEDELREYQAQVNRRNELLGIAKDRNRSFNQVHSDWIYVVAEDVIDRLFPPAENWTSRQVPQ